MKLDPTVLRNMNKQDVRVLEAVEYGMKTHELVPSALIHSIANLRHGGTQKILSTLLRDHLISHDQSCGYDGYRLTNAGQDILALHYFKSRHILSAIGRRIGTGKESDVYLAMTSANHTHVKNSQQQEQSQHQVVLKFHRLGRTSFRNVKKKRDYFVQHSQKRNSSPTTFSSSSSSSSPNSWLFLSTLSAKKEYTFMKALHDVGYSTPQPIAINRHVVVMTLIRGMPLYQILPSRISPAQAKSIFRQSLQMIVRLLSHGLIHCDLNEFNLLVDLSGIQESIARGESLQEPDDFEEKKDTVVYHPRHENPSHSPPSSLMGQKTRYSQAHSKTSILGDSYYVRHCGKSMAGPGALSIHNPMQRFSITEENGERITERPPEPKEFLNDQGEVKPIVTLIDFPQMVSIHHPNAKEYFERDVQGLKRFFGTKLRCPCDDTQRNNWQWNQTPKEENLYDSSNQDEEEEEENEEDEDSVVMIPQWEDLVQVDVDGKVSCVVTGTLSDQEQTSTGREDDCDSSIVFKDMDSKMDLQDPNTIHPSSSSLTQVLKQQLRLDQLLKASGFSEEDAARDSELYYFRKNSIQHETKVGNDSNEEEDEDGEENDGEGENEGEEQDSVIVNTQDPREGAYHHMSDEPYLEEQTTYEPEDNKDDVSIALSTLTLEQKEMLLTAKVQAAARERVVRHLQDTKRKQHLKGAFASRNSNKTFIKGKRIFQDYGPE